eukprot:1820638-Alexandrium_andersonii.AAC.1
MSGAVALRCTRFAREGTRVQSGNSRERRCQYRSGTTEAPTGGPERRLRLAPYGYHTASAVHP